jgi:MFS family permease
VPALPDLQKEFSVGYDLIAWVLTIYLFTGAITTPIIGKLGDLYGKKKLLLVSMVIYAIGVTFSGFAPNISILLTFRAIQGIGISMFPLAFSIIRDEFPRNRIPLAQGLISAMFSVGSSMGLVVGATITQLFDWRMTYHSVIPIVFLLLFLVRMKVRESKISIGGKVDFLGTSFFALCVLSFLIALTRLNDLGWSSLEILGLFSSSFLFLFVFLIIERRSKSPMIDLSLIRSRNVLIPNIVITVVGLTMFMMFQSISVFVRSPPPIGFGSSVVETGVILVPFSLVSLILAPLSGILISKVGSKGPSSLGMLIAGIGFLIMAFIHESQIQLGLGITVIAVGMSLTQVGLITMLVLSVSQNITGITTGINSLFRIIGSVIGPILAAVFMSIYTIQIPIDQISTTFPSEEAYVYIFITASIVSIVSSMIILFAKDTRSIHPKPTS